MSVFSCIFLIMVMIWILYPNRQMIKKKESSFGIFTVFIMRENILFLEEWLDYHWMIGFRHFYLFDNSKVQKKVSPDNKYLIPGKRNKHGIDYKRSILLSVEEMEKIWRLILQKYGKAIYYNEWSPVDISTGKIVFDQLGALNYFNKHVCDKAVVDWIACIDMDEYIYVKDNDIKEYFKNIGYWISSVTIQQISFENRFMYPDKYVIEITGSLENHDLFYHFVDRKYIYRAGTADRLGIHTWEGRGISYMERDRERLGYMHYNRKELKKKRERKLFTDDFIKRFEEREHWMTREKKSGLIDKDVMYARNNS